MLLNFGFPSKINRIQFLEKIRKGEQESNLEQFFVNEMGGIIALAKYGNFNASE